MDPNSHDYGCLQELHARLRARKQLIERHHLGNIGDTVLGSIAEERGDVYGN